MKAIMISIQPKWCKKIVNKEKTIEVRKKRPKLETPFKSYIYKTKETHGKLKDVINDLYDYGKVIGEFICDSIDEFHEWQLQPNGRFQEAEQKDLENFLNATCLTLGEVWEYRKNMPYYKPLYGWHISDLKIYDKPKELCEFWAYNAEWHKQFENEEDFCCYNATNEYGELLNECCSDIENASVERCYHCWEEWSGWCHRVTRPPQSWCYVEELCAT